MTWDKVATLMVVWFFIALLGGIFDGGFGSITTSHIDPGHITSGGDALNTVLSGQILNMTNLKFLPIEIPMPNPSYFTAIGSLALLNFSFFDVPTGTTADSPWRLLLLVRFGLLSLMAGPLFYKVCVEIILPGIFFFVGQLFSGIRNLFPI